MDELPRIVSENSVSGLYLDLMTCNFGKKFFGMVDAFLRGSPPGTKKLWVTLATRNKHGMTSRKLVGRVKSMVTRASRAAGVPMSLKTHHGYHRRFRPESTSPQDERGKRGTSMITLHFAEGYRGFTYYRVKE